MELRRREWLCGMAGAAVWGAGVGAWSPAWAQKTMPGVAPLPPVLRPPPRLLVPGAEQPIVLRRVALAVEVCGTLVESRLEFEFFNPNARVLEGELQFPLLEGQRVVGMAMDVDGQLREAVAVPKAQAEAVFEDVIRTRVDPALLTVTQGHQHKLRVYPLLPQQSKRVVLRIAENLGRRDGLGLLRAPLDFGGSVGELTLDLRVTNARGEATAARASLPGATLPPFAADDGGQRLRWTARSWQGSAVLELAVPLGAGASTLMGERQGRQFFVAQVPVPPALLQATPRLLSRRLLLLWDASGSGAERDHEREFALLDAWFDRARESLSGEVEVRLVRLRDAPEAPRSFRIRGAHWQGLRRELQATVYDGATNLGAAPLEDWAGEVLLFSDGLSTYGPARRPAASGRAPVFAISAATRNNAVLLRALAEGTGGSFIDLLAASPAEAAAQLLSRTPRLLSMSCAGAKSLVAASTRAQDACFTIAGELQAAGGRLVLGLGVPRGPGGAGGAAMDDDIQRIEVPLGGGAPSPLAAQAWAHLRIAELEGAPELHRAEIRRLSQAFGLASSEASLLILERAEDYARHEVPAPPDIAERVAQLRSLGLRRAQEDEAAQLERVVAGFREREAWWDRRLPQDEWPEDSKWMRRELAPRAPGPVRGDGRVLEPDAAMRPPPPAYRPLLPAPPSSPPRAAAAAPPTAPTITISREAPPADASQAAKASGAGEARRVAAGNAPSAATVRLQVLQGNSPALQRLREAGTSEAYQVYLDLRPDHLASSAFFFEAAEIFFQRGQVELALRVLSNLAEMDLENRQLLRALAARLLQAERPALAVPLLRRVSELAPHEPQSHRDLGLALAATGEPRQLPAAVQALVQVTRKPWPRSPEIEQIALAELNALLAATKGRAEAGLLDARLQRNLPLDLRIVLSWDSDNTDVDLWVVDPLGEAAHYGHRMTRQGGRMSQDATGGYGPEEFALRTARPGLYRIYVSYFGHRQQVIQTATTVQVLVSTGFGTPRQRDRRISLRLREPRERALVGEVEVA